MAKLYYSIMSCIYLNMGNNSTTMTYSIWQKLYYNFVCNKVLCSTCTTISSNGIFGYELSLELQYMAHKNIRGGILKMWRIKGGKVLL